MITSGTYSTGRNFAAMQPSVVYARYEGSNNQASVYAKLLMFGPNGELVSEKNLAPYDYLIGNDPNNPGQLFTFYTDLINPALVEMHRSYAQSFVSPTTGLLPTYLSFEIEMRYFVVDTNNSVIEDQTKRSRSAFQSLYAFIDGFSGTTIDDICGPFGMLQPDYGVIPISLTTPMCISWVNPANTLTTRDAFLKINYQTGNSRVYKLLIGVSLATNKARSVCFSTNLETLKGTSFELVSSTVPGDTVGLTVPINLTQADTIELCKDNFQSRSNVYQLNQVDPHNNYSILFINSLGGLNGFRVQDRYEVAVDKKTTSLSLGRSITPSTSDIFAERFTDQGFHDLSRVLQLFTPPTPSSSLERLYSEMAISARIFIFTQNAVFPAKLTTTKVVQDRDNSLIPVYEFNFDYSSSFIVPFI